ncbi:hypothetical protein [Streptomyces sp. JJ38]|uniref:hypothetical protein n=1 Tax=Streptomyces sp. JJ38 TaxID=2738128 RepID=UPI001C58595B|nr:hypothetical protein [Streptomyces sp. JJ38]
MADYDELCHGVFAEVKFNEPGVKGIAPPERIVDETEAGPQYPGNFCTLRRPGDESLKFDISYAWAASGSEFRLPEEHLNSDLGQEWYYGGTEHVELIAMIGGAEIGVRKIRFLCQEQGGGEPRTVEGRLEDWMDLIGRDGEFSVLLASGEKAAKGFGCRNDLVFPDVADVEHAPEASPSVNG